MGRKYLIFIVIIAILLSGGYYLFQKNKAQAPAAALNQEPKITQKTAVKTSQTQIEPPVTPQSIQNKTAIQTPAGNVDQNIDGNNMQVVEVDFDGAKFTPATMNINVGDWVFFKNKSSVNFWPASDPHPTHTDYPGFDALKPIAASGEYKFQFTKAGSWGYHDHLDPSIHGVINVSK